MFKAQYGCLIAPSVTVLNIHDITGCHIVVDNLFFSSDNHEYIFVMFEV